MKKIIVGVSSLLVLAFIVFLTVSAQDKDNVPAKSKAEVTKECSQCPSATACTGHSESAAVSCDPVKCKEDKCDPTKCKACKCDPATCTAHKNGKCDPAICTAHTGNGAKSCDHTIAGCKGTCLNAGK